MVTYGLPDPGDALVRAIDEADANTAIFYAFAPTAKASTEPPLLLARKIKYFSNSIALFELGVDASAPNALPTLDKIVRSLDLR